MFKTRAHKLVIQRHFIIYCTDKQYIKTNTKMFLNHPSKKALAMGKISPDYLIAFVPF